MPQTRATTNGFVVLDPSDYVQILGSTFLKHEQRPLLTVGGLSWNRHTLGRIGCPHPMAAAALDRVLKELEITTLQQLADHAQQIGTYKGIGVTAYWTVLAILRQAGYTIETVHGEAVSYQTIKQRARRAEQKARPRKRKRRAGPPSEATA